MFEDSLCSVPQERGVQRRRLLPGGQELRAGAQLGVLRRRRRVQAVRRHPGHRLLPRRTDLRRGALHCLPGLGFGADARFGRTSVRLHLVVRSRPSMRVDINITHMSSTSCLSSRRPARALRRYVFWSAVLLPQGHPDLLGRRLLPSGQGVRAQVLPAWECVRQRRVQAAQEVRQDGERNIPDAVLQIYCRQCCSGSVAEALGEYA